MLDFFTRHRQMTGMILIPALLMWFALSCQHCFAGTGTESSMHANSAHQVMDCCPSSGAEDERQQSTADNCCSGHSLVAQPPMVDVTTVQLADVQSAPLALSIRQPVATSPPLLAHLLNDPKGLHYFSDRLFSSYRILLI